MKTMPSAESIIEDVEHRVGLLARLLVDRDLSDDHWNELVFYGALHREQRQAFIDALHGIRRGGDPADLIGDLAPHARWLAAVYSGAELSGEWCAGGSRFHSRVIDALGGRVRPSRIVRQVAGLPAALSALKKRMLAADPRVVDNIAVDETFEQLGRAMST